MRSPDHMEEKDIQSPPPTQQQQEEKEEEKSPAAGRGGGGWGGWGFSSFSLLSDLQKAAEEISRNAVAVAKNAAKSIAEVEPSPDASDSETSPHKYEDAAAPATASTAENIPSKGSKAGADDESEDNVLRNSALDRLEKASEDSLFGQGLKVLDNSVESLTSGAWFALGNAWSTGSTLVHKLENSAANLADTIQHGALPVNASSLAPSILETGKSFTARGMQVLEQVGKDTMDLLIKETGLEVDKTPEGFNHEAHEEQFEETTFERCFYIYGGPEQLEELEALSNHYALLFNRKKAKLLSEQKSFYDGKLKQIQQILDLGSEIEENGADTDKGKHVELADDAVVSEMKNLHDSSVIKAADMAAGFAAAVGGLAANDIIQRTMERLDTAHAEGVHRLSEICCFVVSHVLMLGKSVISNANKRTNEDTMDDIFKVDWPVDSVLKARIIRCKAQSMCGDVESVSNSFVTGISEITEAYQSTIQNVGVHEEPKKNSIIEKANMISNNLRADQTTALGKIQDALQYLPHLVLSTSMPSP